MKTLLLAAAAFTCLMLTACDNSPAKKPVNEKPVDPSKQVSSPGDKFRNPGSTDKPGAGAGAPPTPKEGENK